MGKNSKTAASGKAANTGLQIAKGSSAVNKKGSIYMQTQMPNGGVVKGRKIGAAKYEKGGTTRG
jgi:hypothetical protein